MCGGIDTISFRVLQENTSFGNTDYKKDTVQKTKYSMRLFKRKSNRNTVEVS